MGKEGGVGGGKHNSDDGGRVVGQSNDARSNFSPSKVPPTVFFLVGKIKVAPLRLICRQPDFLRGDSKNLGNWRFGRQLWMTFDG